MDIRLHKGDLPSDIDYGVRIGIDTETMGLVPERDRLCVVQICTGGGVVHIVHFDFGDYSAPNLRALLSASGVEKIFHFARFDMGVFYRFLDIMPTSVYCTKIASKFARTYTDKHGLKDLCRELLGIDLSKQQQSSYWGSEILSDAQLHYAAGDVLHLHDLHDRLEHMLVRERRDSLAHLVMKSLHMRVLLDHSGWRDEDIFSH